jgi:hypothetical protein
MEKYINGEQQFQLIVSEFSIAPTTAGYTLAFSLDGEHFVAYEEATDANAINFVKGVAGTYYKLSGNTDNNVLIKG